MERVIILSRVCTLVAAVFAACAPAFSAEPFLGIQPIRGDSINFVIEFPKRCMFGDFDAIKQDMMWGDRAKQQTLLISLQALDGGTEYVSEILSEVNNRGSQQELAQFMNKTLSEGYPVDINIAPPKSPQLFALTVCKDSSGLRSCKRSAEGDYRDIGELLKLYRDPKPGFTSPDSIYFYQLVAVGANGVSFSKETLSDEKKVGKFVANSNVTTPAPQYVANRLNTIKSYQLGTKGDRLTLKLPMFDPVKCGQQPPQSGLPKQGSKR